jgi:DNA replication ATP-dependent helicase Dna2
VGHPPPADGAPREPPGRGPSAAGGAPSVGRPGEGAGLSLTATGLAAHFRYGCERRLTRQLAGVEPPVGTAGDPLLRRAGLRFERRVVGSLLLRHGEARVLAGPPGTRGRRERLPFERVLSALSDPGGLRWLVRPELRVTPGAAERRGIPGGVRLAPAVPDLVRITRGPRGRPVLDVVDLRSSRDGGVHHRIRIACYALLLAEIRSDAGFDARVETRRGWLWSRGRRRPEAFPLAPYRHHLERFLADELPAIAARGVEAAGWHVGPRCAGCAHLAGCTAEAERTDHLSRIAGLSRDGAAALRDRGITTVGELRRAEFRRGVYTGHGSLERMERALKKRAQALDFGRVVEADPGAWSAEPRGVARVLLVAEADPVTGTVRALGLRVERDGRPALEGAWLSPRPSASGEDELLRTLLDRLAEWIPAGGPVGFHTWDRREGSLVSELLGRRMVVGTDAAPTPDPALGALLTGTGAPLAPSPVLDRVERLYALPLAHAWDLAGVSALLRPRAGGHVHLPEPVFAGARPGGMALERIHGARASGARAVAAREGALRAVRSRLLALSSVLLALREAAGRRSDLPDPPTLPPPPGDGVPLKHASLERLRWFVAAEARAEAVALRELHALPTPERAARSECLSGLELQEILPGGRAVFTFDEACRDTRLRPGDFSLVVTNDDGGRGLAATHAHAWLRRRSTVELVEYDHAASPPRVTLASERGWERLASDRHGGRPLLDLGRVAVLDRAPADVNAARLLSTLAALDAGAGHAAFVLGVLEGRVPQDWITPLDPAAEAAGVLARAAAAAGRPLLNPEQESAWRAPFERAVTVVWGPPGTGKTYLLAWMLIGLADAARVAGRPLRVLVSAATHRAIANVLVRVAGEAAACGVEIPFSPIKLAGRGSEADAELARAGVALVPDGGLEHALADADEAGLVPIVGATTWSLWKAMRAVRGDPATPVHPLFDVVVLDEAAQMKVPEALVALSSVRGGARVILAGDDRQLAPILRGRYAGAGTLAGSAFSHLAARFGRLPLRESRRMNEALVRWPARNFYPGYRSAEPHRTLHTAGKGRGAGDPLDGALGEALLRPDEPAVLCTYDAEPGDRGRALEAWLAARLALVARARMLDPGTGRAYTAEAFVERGLAILSPHRAQNGAILAELLAAGWPAAELPVVDTVERMQGNERELVVVSYGVGDPERAAREAAFLLDPYRFNVAITRARSKLVVLASAAVLRLVPPDAETMDGAAALQGWPAHLGPPVRSIELPHPRGGLARLRVHAAALTAA